MIQQGAVVIGEFHLIFCLFLLYIGRIGNPS